MVTTPSVPGLACFYLTTNLALGHGSRWGGATVPFTRHRTECLNRLAMNHVVSCLFWTHCVLGKIAAPCRGLFLHKTKGALIKPAAWRNGVT